MHAYDTNGDSPSLGRMGGKVQDTTEEDCAGLQVKKNRNGKAKSHKEGAHIDGARKNREKSSIIRILTCHFSAKVGEKSVQDLMLPSVHNGSNVT